MSRAARSRFPKRSPRPLSRVRCSPPRMAPGQPMEERAPLFSDLRYDLTALTSRGRLSVRGRGIDAELDGTLTIGGPTSASDHRRLRIAPRHVHGREPHLRLHERPCHLRRRRHQQPHRSHARFDRREHIGRHHRESHGHGLCVGAEIELSSTPTLPRTRYSHGAAVPAKRNPTVSAGAGAAFRRDRRVAHERRNGVRSARIDSAGRWG